jgi:hypothetical protein
VLYSPVEEEWQRTTVGSLGDAGAAAGYKNGALVLELKVPLQRRDPGGYGVCAPAGTVIGMGARGLPRSVRPKPGVRDVPARAAPLEEEKKGLSSRKPSSSGRPSRSQVGDGDVLSLFGR